MNASEIDARLDLIGADLEETLAEIRRDLTAIAVKLFGPNLHQLRATAGEIESVAAEVPGLVDVSVESQADVPQLQIRANRGAMARYGVTPGDLAEMIDVAFRGEVVSQVREGERAFDVLVRYGDASRTAVSPIWSGQV